MTKSIVVSLCAVVCFSSCASILTGTKQTVSLTSSPSDSRVLVMSGLPANVIVRAKQVTHFKDLIIEAFAPHIDAKTLAFLRSLSPEELLTQVAVALKFPDAPSDTYVLAGRVFENVPSFVREKVTDLIGLETVTTTPAQLELKKGKPYAIISWQPQMRARVLAIDTTFNWVTLLNILTLGLGFIVDGLTGAWLNLTPSTLEFQLLPLTPP